MDGGSFDFSRLLDEGFLEHFKYVSVFKFWKVNSWKLVILLSPSSSRFKGIGIDGAINMIENAKKIDPNGNYLCTNLEPWESSEKFDLIISMEVIYYLKNPQKFVGYKKKSNKLSSLLFINNKLHCLFYL